MRKRTRFARSVALSTLLLGVSLVVSGPQPSAHAHQRHRHESPKETPAASAAPSAPLAEPAHQAPEHEHREDNATAATTDHPYPPEGVPRPLAWLGKFHPAAVNFPIAMLTAAALSELLLLRTGRELFFHATRFAVWVGSLGALAAAILGWFFAGFRLADEEWLMTTHRWLGTAASAWALVVLFLCERAYRRAERQAFRLALFPGAALMATTGFFGGALLFGIDHYAW
ncbi:MAG: hypothetical protein IH974_06400 [Myxococcales bacterium]|nr:hypothetical protein [Myxococcales bacterium]